MSPKTISIIRKTGLFTKGLVYTLMGALTALAILNMGGKASGKKEIGTFLKSQPLGNLLLAAVALGLLAYTLWRFYQAYADPGAEKKKERIPTRIRYAYSGFFYGFIAYGFIKILFNASSGGNKKQQLLAKLLEEGWGLYAVGVVAALVLGQSIFQFKKGISGDYMDKLDNHPEAKREYQLIKKAGLLGYLSRGIVFLVISYLLVRVILDHNANRYQDTQGVFHYISSLTFGDYLLGIVAIGLILYGIFNIMVARNASLTRVS